MQLYELGDKLRVSGICRLYLLTYLAIYILGIFLLQLYTFPRKCSPHVSIK